MRQLSLEKICSKAYSKQSNWDAAQALNMSVTTLCYILNNINLVMKEHKLTIKLLRDTKPEKVQEWCTKSGFAFNQKFSSERFGAITQPRNVEIAPAEVLAESKENVNSFFDFLNQPDPSTEFLEYLEVVAAEQHKKEQEEAGKYVDTIFHFSDAEAKEEEEGTGFEFLDELPSPKSEAVDKLAVIGWGNRHVTTETDNDLEPGVKKQRCS
jgi:hypothetical protein